MVNFLMNISPIYIFVNIRALITKRSVFSSKRAGIFTKVWIGVYRVYNFFTSFFQFGLLAFRRWVRLEWPQSVRTDFESVWRAQMTHRMYCFWKHSLRLRVALKKAARVRLLAITILAGGPETFFLPHYREQS